MLSEDPILYAILTFLGSYIIFFIDFCYQHGAGEGEEFDNKLRLSE